MPALVAQIIRSGSSPHQSMTVSSSRAVSASPPGTKCKLTGRQMGAHRAADASSPGGRCELTGRRMGADRAADGSRRGSRWEPTGRQMPDGMGTKFLEEK
ncbi:MAG: hypothetical protein PUI88_09125 [Prevotella sp.]|nr:hypothetical protein [Prevotella sp.]